MTQLKFMIETLQMLKASIKQNKPLIHCLTNSISINDCANVVLALGAKPIMAEHPKEVAEITKVAQAVALNLGNITDSRMEAMLISAQTARAEGIPVVLDLVGVGCSTLRRNYAKTLITKYPPQVIKGNMSELKALAQVFLESTSDGLTSHAKGIDVGVQDQVTEENLHKSAAFIKALALKCGAVVVGSGAIDLISDGKETYSVRSGSERMAYLTGTGCMLNVMIGTFISTGAYLEGSLLATLWMGICGEIATKAEGCGDYHIALLNAIGGNDDLQLGHFEKLEEAK